MTSFDFEDGNGLVEAHQHLNGGGWVANTAHVDVRTYVGPGATVRDKARVFGKSRISDTVQVYGETIIINLSLGKISGDAGEIAGEIYSQTKEIST